MSDKNHPVGRCLKQAIMALHDQTVSALTAGDEAEDIIRNPKSWVAWKREAERLQEEMVGLKRRNAELMSTLSRMAGDA